MLSYNHGEFIEKAIDSVLLQCNNSFDVELIIIDDGSTDQTIDILDNLENISKLSVAIIKKKHSGVTAITRNFLELIDNAKGDYITFLASDDEFVENRFHEQVAIMEKSKNIQFVYANGVNVFNGIRIGNTNSIKSAKALATKDPEIVYNYITSKIPTIFIQSILVRSDFIKSFEAFDSELIADDWVFNIRIFKKLVDNNLSYDYIEKPLFFRNIHDTNTSRNDKVHYLRIKQVIGKYCRKDIMLQMIIKLNYKFFKKSIKKGEFLNGFYFLLLFLRSENLLKYKIKKIFSKFTKNAH
jgi:glycosyltransferase involved in cell wall biosynthesis